MDIKKLKQQINDRWGNYPSGELAVAIVEFLTEKPRSQLQMLTLTTFAKALHREIDVDLIAAVNILANSSLAVLEAKALFVDEEENEIPLEHEELLAAHTTGELVHPETGAMISDYQRHLVPFFVPSESFFE